MPGEFDADTDGAYVAGVVAGDVAGVVATVPEGFEAFTASSDWDAAGVVVAVVAVVAWVVGWAALAVEIVCVAARPANRPVPASAPASDQLVTCLIRARPASRSLRLRGVTPRVLMPKMVDHGPKGSLRRR